MCFCWSCVAGVARLACLLAFPPSLPHFLGKYQFHTLVLPVQCCVDRCLEVGCGSVAMVTSLLLRRLLPSSVAIFKAPTLQYSIVSEFNETFSKCFLPSTVLKNTIKKLSHHTCKRDIMVQSYPNHTCYFSSLCYILW